MIEENPKPSYLNEKVIIKDNRAYLLWVISLIIGFVMSLISTAFISIPVFLFMLFLNFIGFLSFNSNTMPILTNGLLHELLLCGICFAIFLIPIFFRKTLVLKKQWYIFVAIIIFPTIFLVSSQLSNIVLDNTLVMVIKLFLGTASNIFGILVFLNFLDQSDKPFKDIKIGFGPKAKEPTEEEKAAIEKLKNLNIVGKIFH